MEELTSKEIKKEELHLEEKKIEYTGKVSLIKTFCEMSKSSSALFLPEGSVRAILSLVMLIGCALLLYKGILVPEWYSTSLLMILGFYFGSKSQPANNK